MRGVPSIKWYSPDRSQTIAVNGPWIRLSSGTYLLILLSLKLSVDGRKVGNQSKNSWLSCCFNFPRHKVTLWFTKPHSASASVSINLDEILKAHQESRKFGDIIKSRNRVDRSRSCRRRTKEGSKRCFSTEQSSVQVPPKKPNKNKEKGPNAVLSMATFTCVRALTRSS